MENLNKKYIISDDTLKYVTSRLVNAGHKNPLSTNGGSDKIDKMLLNPKNSVAFNNATFPVLA